MPIIVDIDLEAGKVAQVNLSDAEVVGIESAGEIGDFFDSLCGDDGRWRENEIIKRDFVQKLLRLAGLTSFQRTVIERFFFREEEPAAIARELKISRSRVHQALKTSIRKLQKAAAKLGVNP